MRWTPRVASCAFEHILSDGHQWCPTNLKYSHAVNCHSSKRKMVMATCGVLLLDENGEARCPATHKCFGNSKPNSKNLSAKWKNLKVLQGRWRIPPTFYKDPAINWQNCFQDQILKKQGGSRSVWICVCYAEKFLSKYT